MRFAPAPGTTPERTIRASASALSRTSAPLPLPAVALPKKSVSAPPASAPLDWISAPEESTICWFAVSTKSGALSAEPRLFTMILPLFTLTVVPALVSVRTPPMSKLSAPNAERRAGSSTSASGELSAVGRPITMSLVLAISTSPPRFPGAAEASTRPLSVMLWVAWSTSWPASPGRRGIAA